MRLRATRLSAISNALRSVFKIASVNPVLWWDAESHRAALAGGAATLFQDSAGTSAVTVVEQPVGLVLDTRQPQYGPELISNGDFGGGLTGWIASANFSVVGGAARSDGTNSVYAPLRQLGVFVAGKAYEICFDLSVTSGSLTLWIDGQQFVAATSASGRRSFFVKANFSGSLFFEAAPSSVISIDNVSVREVLGVTALQATSTARPLLTARKNLLTYSGQFDNAVWVKPAGVSVASNVSSAPDGATTADSVTFSNTSGYLYSSISSTHSAGSAFTWSLYVRTATRAITWGGATPSGADVFSVVDVGGGWYRQTLTRTFTNASTGAVVQAMLLATLPAGLGPHIVWGAQLEFGAVATSYQRINAATEYDITTGPLMMRFDGLDDGVGSTFPVNTLPASADVYVVARCAPGDGNSVVLYGSATHYLGMLESGSASRPDGSSGVPTYTVNGSSVAATRTALKTAMPEGGLRLLEVRSADLSAWTSATLGQFVNYRFLGGIGAVLIVPAQSDSTRSKIRKALAKTYQITGVI